MRILFSTFIVMCLNRSLIKLVFIVIYVGYVSSDESPALDFSRHRTVQPTVHHVRTKREISSTKEPSGAHHPEVTMKLEIGGEEHVLDLRLNERLLPEEHVLSYQQEGRNVLHKPGREEVEICQYAGSVRGRSGSWVALSTCRGVRGVIYDNQRLLYIEPAQDDVIQSPHYIYDHSDLNKSYRCGYKAENVGSISNTYHGPLKENTEKQGRMSSGFSRNKRASDASNSEVHRPYNADQRTRYVELVLVADYGEFRANGNNKNAVHRKMMDLANIINSVYAPLNIFIALVGVEIWSEGDKIYLEEDSNRTLTNFLKYREDTLLAKIPNDNAHLITRQTFFGDIVGKAFKHAMCSSSKSGGVESHHTKVLGLFAMTVAHEMGHNFGMHHDDDAPDCKCPEKKCIMSSYSTSTVPVHWSSCSMRSLVVAFGMGIEYCLRNEPKRSFARRCGNGFVEPGEECDCGPTKKTNACHACCDPRTCKLRHNATCASGACCDLHTCRPKSAGVVCRSSAKECDLPEFCTGISEYCPLDVHKMDTTPCGSNNEAVCMHGSCNSYKNQCRMLWGLSADKAHDQCYASNAKGDVYGNCGYDHFRKSYRRCERDDTMCGMLHCWHVNDGLEFGGTVATTVNSYPYINGKINHCRGAVIDLGQDNPSPGLVPDGAKCGRNKMCFNQRCVDVAAVRQQTGRLKGSVCPSDCSGHGVCNSLGRCHCEPGFAPPLCELPGPGGSEDSGPATDTTVLNNFKIAMYIIFLGIVPLIALFLFIYCYWRNAKGSITSPMNILLCRNISNNTQNHSSFFVGKLSSIRTITHNIRNSLSCKRSSTNVNSNNPKEEEEVNRTKTITKHDIIMTHTQNNVTGNSKTIYANFTELKKTENDDVYVTIAQSAVQNKPNVSEIHQNNKNELTKAPQKNCDSKITKVDITIVGNGTNVTKPTLASSKTNITESQIANNDTDLASQIAKARINLNKTPNTKVNVDLAKIQKNNNKIDLKKKPIVNNKPALSSKQKTNTNVDQIKNDLASTSISNSKSKLSKKSNVKPELLNKPKISVAKKTDSHVDTIKKDLMSKSLANVNTNVTQVSIGNGSTDINKTSKTKLILRRAPSPPLK